MTEKDIAIATFRAVAAVYYRLFGEQLQLRVETDDGFVNICEVERPHPAVGLSHSYDHSGQIPTPVASDLSADAT